GPSARDGTLVGGGRRSGRQPAAHVGRLPARAGDRRRSPAWLAPRGPLLHLGAGAELHPMARPRDLDRAPGPAPAPVVPRLGRRQESRGGRDAGPLRRVGREPGSFDRERRAAAGISVPAALAAGAVRKFDSAGDGGRGPAGTPLHAVPQERNLSPGRSLAMPRSLLLVVLAAACLALPREAPADLTAAASRKSSPDFRLRDSKGRSVRLSDYKGRVVLLDFWATWCEGCQTEIPWY